MGYAWRKNSLLSQGFYGGEVKGGGAGLSLVPATGQFKAVPGQVQTVHEEALLYQQSGKPLE